MQDNNNAPFPEQDGSEKIHGTIDSTGNKEKYLRDAGKIEDYPENHGVAKMSSEINDPDKRSDTERKEDNSGTDERKTDLNLREL